MRQLLQHLGNGQTMLAAVPAPADSPGKVVIRNTRSLVSAGTERMLVDFGKASWLGKARAQPEKVHALLNKVRSEGALATWQAVRAKLDQPIPLGYCSVGVVVAGPDAVKGKLGLVNSSIAQDDAGKSELSRVNCGKNTDPQLPITNPPSPAGTTLRVGDRVVSNGPHAEIVAVSEKLCAKIPDAVSDAAASFTPLAAIALEGIDLLGVRPGEKVVVTGLGLIGQLAVRILRARGCEVMGFDPAEERRALAARHGASTTAPGVDPVTGALAWSGGQGVAGVLITASTSSNQVISQAARSCRYRGKVVLVGVVGLQLNRADFYRNEVSFQVSCSYGRRDHTGPGSVRANINQVLAWMAEGKLPVEDLITHRFAFEEAPRAYEVLADRQALGILLEYRERSSRVNSELGAAGAAVNGEWGIVNGPETSRSNPESPITSPQPSDPLFARTITLRDSSTKTNRPAVALIGAGNFAGRTLLPALAKLKSAPTLKAVVSNQGASAYILAEKFGAHSASTDLGAIYRDKEIEAVFITTRHNDHAEQTLAALQAGKHVWVEKPLCLTLDELRAIERVMGDRGIVNGEGERKLAVNCELGIGNGSEPSTSNHKSPLTSHISPSGAAGCPHLMVGFNRRFAPMAVALRKAIVSKLNRIKVRMVMNAGKVDPDHWVLDPKSGGGRIVGEACHFVDLARYLVGEPMVKVECTRRDTDGQDGGCFLLHFEGGSMAEIDYRTDLPVHLPKETVDVSGDGWSARILNWSKLTSSGLGGLSKGSWWSRAPRKGHPQALQVFLSATTSGPAPIPFPEIAEVSRWSIVMQGMKAGETVSSVPSPAGRDQTAVTR